MKLHTLLFAAFLLVLTGCKKDEITVVDAVEEDTDVDVIDTTGDYTLMVVFSPSGSASVSGTVDGITATVSGNDVTIVNSIAAKVAYNVSGSTSDGFLKIYSGRKQSITLNGASITNTRGAAINVQGTADAPNKGKRVDLVLNGSNSLADGSSYSLTPSTEDEKAALFSE